MHRNDKEESVVLTPSRGWRGNEFVAPGSIRSTRFPEGARARGRKREEEGEERERERERERVCVCVCRGGEAMAGDVAVGSTGNARTRYLSLYGRRRRRECKK